MLPINSFRHGITEIILILGALASPLTALGKEAIIINHTSTNIKSIPESAVKKARENLRIAYGHTSHGSQIISGLERLGDWAAEAKLPAAPLLQWKSGAKDFDLRDTPFSGASDLGNPNRTAWSDATREFLKKNPEINVVMWSWCGQMGWASTEEIDLYLKLMTILENEFPKVQFVYMTGHLDGSGEKGKHFKNAEQIRSYCRQNGKILYDFADIESWDPDGKINFNKLNANDNCDYDPAGGESRSRNWANDWQQSNHGKWYACSAAHSQALNANLKAFAAWHLFARLAGWSGQ